jgi:hypothetical protein
MSDFEAPYFPCFHVVTVPGSREVAICGADSIQHFTWIDGHPLYRNPAWPQIIGRCYLHIMDDNKYDPMDLRKVSLNESIIISVMTD